MQTKLRKDLSITVLMSVFNGERWLAESLRSILNQTFTDFEFIIINDGSTDGTLKILEKHANQDSRIKLYDKENSGLTDSLNFGISKAKGKWIARIDADDIAHHERLKDQIELAESDKSLVLIGSGISLIDSKGHNGKLYSYPTSHKKLIKHISKGLPFFAHSSAIFKTSSVREIGGYRGKFKRSQDQDLWLRLADLGRIACINKPLAFIRKHDNQISNDDDGQQQVVYSHMAMTSFYLKKLN